MFGKAWRAIRTPGEMPRAGGLDEVLAEDVDHHQPSRPEQGGKERDRQGDRREDQILRPFVAERGQ